MRLNVRGSWVRGIWELFILYLQIFHKSKISEYKVFIFNKEKTTHSLKN